MRLLPIGLAIWALAVLLPGRVFAQPAAFCEAGQTPEFVLGFETLKQAVGEAMGEPTECEHANPLNGDALQKTTRGLSFYRALTNTPTFTNGPEHWALTSHGLVYWIGDEVDPPGVLVLRGEGTTRSQSFSPSARPSVVRLTHSGSGEFKVRVPRGERNILLAGAVGPYVGSHPLQFDGPLEFSIETEGAWSLVVQPIDAGGALNFSAPHVSGTRDADYVSPLFTPPVGSMAVRFTHDGMRRMAVTLYCGGGPGQRVLDATGPFSQELSVRFGEDPCYWAVHTNGGGFSIEPSQRS